MPKSAVTPNPGTVVRDGATYTLYKGRTVLTKSRNGKVLARANMTSIVNKANGDEVYYPTGENWLDFATTRFVRMEAGVDVVTCEPVNPQPVESSNQE